MATKEFVISSVVSLIALGSTCSVQGGEFDYATLGNGKSFRRGIWNKNKKIAQAQSDSDSDMTDYYKRKRDEQQDYYRQQMQQDSNQGQGSGYGRGSGYYYGPSEGRCGEGTCG